MAQQTPVVEVAYPPKTMVKVGNLIARLLLSSPLGGSLRKQFMLLRFTGRKTGRRYVVPVTAHRSGEKLYALTCARWRVNFRDDADLEVTWDGRTTAMHGELLEDPEAAAAVYTRRIEELGLKRAQRDIGIKIHRSRTPTVEEITEDIRRLGFSVLWLTPKG